MGTWSCTIFGSDDALDVMSTIENIVEKNGAKSLDKEYFSLYPLIDLAHNNSVRESLKKALIKCNESPDLLFYDNESIFYQILCSFYMASGAPIPDFLIENGLYSGENDYWASKDEERKLYMDAYVKALKNYDGTPIYENSEGLFTMIITKDKDKDEDKNWNTISDLEIKALQEILEE